MSASRGATASGRVTIPGLQAMKAAGEKSVCVVAWDYQMARIADMAGVDIVSVGDTVGVNLWGQPNPLQITMEEILVVAKAVRRGVNRALLSCDFPYGPLQEGAATTVRAAIRLVKEAGVDLVKLDGAADFPEAVEAVTRAGNPGLRAIRDHAANGTQVRHRVLRRERRPGSRGDAGRVGR